MNNDPVVNDPTTSNRLLEIIDILAREMHADEHALGQVKLDTQFERDPGFDSLTRAQLLARIEQTFYVHFQLDTKCDSRSCIV